MSGRGIGERHQVRRGISSGNRKERDNFEELDKHGKIIVKRNRMAGRGLNSQGKSAGS